MFVDERAIIAQLRWALWSQRPRIRSTRYLQISRWQFGADSSIILQFIALRVKARGDAVSIKDGLRTTVCGLGIKYGLGIKRGLENTDKV